jgi:hypothetical protein
MGLGSGIRDPGSGVQKNLRYPGSRGQKGTGCRIQIRNTAGEKAWHSVYSLLYGSTRNTEHRDWDNKKTTGMFFCTTKKARHHPMQTHKNKTGMEGIRGRGGEGRGRGGTLLVFSRFRPLTLQLIWPVSTFPK